MFQNGGLSQVASCINLIDRRKYMKEVKYNDLSQIGF